VSKASAVVTLSSRAKLILLPNMVHLHNIPNPNLKALTNNPVLRQPLHIGLSSNLRAETAVAIRFGIIDPDRIVHVYGCSRAVSIFFLSQQQHD
jgi:hypothetical protein